MQLRARCLFDQADYEEIHQCMAYLSDLDFRIVFLRFWATCSIAQISNEVRLSWDAVDRRLTGALMTLRSRYGLHRSHLGELTPAA
jgi:hypothetical protein